MQFFFTRGDEDKLKVTIDYDDVMCARILDPEMHPKFHDTVVNYMMHGPCGVDDLKSPFAKDGKSTKGFPKSFDPTTTKH